MDFRVRAQLTEWMDEPCTYEDFRDCLRDLAQVNRMTYAYRPTLLWLSKVARRGEAPLHIVDVGCGGGDMLRKVEQWADRQGIEVILTGVDLNPYAAPAARELTTAASAIRWVTGDIHSYESYEPDAPVDLVISSLFTHHLPDEEIVRFIAWMESVTTRGWLINDLHRGRIPYYAFGLLATTMRWHRFVQHDGPVSIRRAFSHGDWTRHLQRAGLSQDEAELLTFRPARLCVSRIKR